MNTLRHPQPPPIPSATPRTRRTALRRRFRAGIRAWLIATGAIFLAPMAALAFFLVLQVHQAGESATQRELAQRSLSTAHAVLERLDSGISYLHALALTDAALTGDLPALYAQAKRVADNFPGATGIGLMGPDLQPRFITIRPYGAPLNKPPDTSTSQRVFATGTAAVSGQFKGPFTGRSVVSLGVPVFRNGDVAYCLFMVLSTESLTDLLLDQRLPRDWTAAIVDKQGTIVARSRDAEKFVGTESTPPLKAFLAARKTGYLDSVTKDNIPVLAYVSPVTPYHWHVAVGVPKRHLVAPLQRNLTLFLAVTLTIFAISLFGAGLAGKALERWTGRLLTSVRAIKTGGQVTPAHSGVTELDQMAHSLTEVHAATQLMRHDLQSTQSERDQAHHALERARMDGLTGLRSRSQFRDEVTAWQLRHGHAQTLALLFIDLDRFKAVNDQHGHQVGDQMLMAVGQVFCGLEAPDCITARWGGDEFAVAFSAPPNQLSGRLTALCTAITAGIEKIGFGLGCSVGVATWDSGCNSLDDLVKRADTSMYRQKQMHREPT